MYLPVLGTGLYLTQPKKGRTAQSKKASQWCALPHGKWCRHTKPRLCGKGPAGIELFKPQKARMLLMLALTKTNDPQKSKLISMSIEEKKANKPSFFGFLGPIMTYES